MDRSPSELRDLLHAQSHAVAYDFVMPFVAVLTTARDLCDGDLDKALILISITLRSTRHPAYRRLQADQVEAAGVLPGYDANMRSIADSTGMARESVRRKVQQLIDAGWLAREGRYLRYTSEGYHALQGVRASIIDMYVRGYGVISALQRGA